MIDVIPIQRQGSNRNAGYLVVLDDSTTYSFVLDDADVAHSLRSDVPDEATEALREKGIEVGDAYTEAEGGLIVEDAHDCDGCRVPMVEVDSNGNAGSTPTSPMVAVRFQCPKCGSALRATVRRE